jgi:hypothetical protein
MTRSHVMGIYNMEANEEILQPIYMLPWSLYRIGTELYSDLNNDRNSVMYVKCKKSFIVV